MKYTFPDDYGEECVLVAIDKSLIPLVSGAIDKFLEQYVWETYEQWELGYNAFAKLKAELMNNCLKELVESNNRLYRLLDTAINGTSYVAFEEAGSPEPFIAPPIPVAPPSVSPAALPAFSLRSRLERLINLADNLVTGQQFPLDPAFLSDSALQNNVGLREKLDEMRGIINAGWFGIGGQRATLADVVTALRVGSESNKDQVLSVLDIISGAGSSATVFNTVRDFFADSVDLGLEGAQFAVLLAATMSQITSNVFLDQKLDRLISSIDGGGVVPPGDNVLRALRGDDQADAERNLATIAGETRDLLEP